MIRIDAGRRIVLALLLAVLWGAGAQAEPRIGWKVENSFRFFLDPGRHRGASRHLGQPDRCRAQESGAGRRAPDGRAPCRRVERDHVRQDLLGSRAQQVRLPRARRLPEPQDHTILANMEGLEDAQTVDCSWLTKPLGRGPRGKAMTLPCDTPVQLEIPYPVRGLGDGRDRRPADRRDRRAQITDLFIVGMGDSFASGEGNPDVPVRFSPDRAADYDATLAGYPARIGDWRAIGDKKFIEENARWQDQACHRSLYSHQLRAALQIAVEDPHRAVTYVGVACSGAETVFGLFLRYKGHEWVPNPPELSQISALAEAQCAGREAPVLRPAGGLPHQRQGARAEGRPRPEEMRCRAGAQDRPDFPLDRRQRRRLRAAGRQRSLVGHVHAAQPGRLVRPSAWLCRGGRPARRARRSRQVGQSRAAQSPARALVGVRPSRADRLPADGHAGRRPIGLPGRPHRHGRAAGFRDERGQGA